MIRCIVFSSNTSSIRSIRSNVGHLNLNRHKLSRFKSNQSQLQAMSENSCQNNRRVLSIQSHVVHGYVGNKSATFPLQVLGFDVDAINSVQFSNHTGYGTVKGQVLTDKDLAQLFEGLERNDLISQYSHLLTGYIGNVDFLRGVSQIVKKLREVNPNLVFVCDPVMGDNGSMYVPKELLPVYCDEIIPLADILTPNQYEIELITKQKIKTEADIWQAVEWFHQRGIKIVAISSSELGAPGTLRAFLSERNGKRYTINIPKQGSKISFVGTGDLFASLLLAHSHQTTDLGAALEKTIATLQSIIARTIKCIPHDVQKPRPDQYELKLVQSKAEIEQPKVQLKAEIVPNE